MNKIIFNSASQLSLWLIAILSAIASQVYAQANYMTIFGNAGCNNTNQMTCLATPTTSSFTAVSNPHDVYGMSLGLTNINYLKNSVYDNAGQLLFSVNANGIYGSDPSGTQIYIFSQPVSYYLSACSASINFYEGQAISEITIFPVPSKCNSYYVMFFSALSGLYTLHGDATSLRVIEVDIIPSAFNTSSPVTSWYSISSDNLLKEPTCANLYNYWDFGGYGIFNIVADAAATPASSRDIYTLTPDGNLSKWTIGTTGALPTAPTLLGTGFPTAYTTKAKIFTISGHKIFDYIWGGGQYANRLYSIDLTDPSHYTCYYTLPVATGSIDGYQDIWGFEYLPTQNIMCFAYDDVGILDLSRAVIPTGGLAYATPTPHGSSTYSDIYTTTSPTNYYHSDLELDKNGDMLMVYDDLSGNGSLATVKASLLTSTFIGSSASISRQDGTCSGTLPISVKNYEYQPESDALGWYLGSQIRGENYSTWGYSDLVSFTVPLGTSVIWTPTNNPVYNASGGTTPVYSISIGGNIEIPAGSSLTITEMTVNMAPATYIDIQTATSHTGLGGRLVLNNTTLTDQSANPCYPVKMWGGVIVEGNPFYPQLTPATSPQGVLTMHNSTISWALTGAHLGATAFTGGGIIQADQGSTFLNDNTGVQFEPYVNFNPSSPSVEINNLSSFNTCTFNTTNVSCLVSGTYTGIYGTLVKGIYILACNFENNTTQVNYTCGISGIQMGFTVSGITVGTHYPPVIVNSSFYNFDIGIVHYGVDASHTPSIGNATFTKNITGILLNNSVAPYVAYNTFNIPYITTPSSMYPFYTTIQSAGLILQGANLYSVYNNVFKAIPAALSPTIPDQTVGVLAWNTGSAENVINNNTYTGLGTANLSNYINCGYAGCGTSYISGLWYRCNSNTSNLIDVAATGNYPHVDGIRNTQGVQPGDDYPACSTNLCPNGFPSANTFSTGYWPGLSIPVLNLYDPSTQVLGYVYLYSGATGTLAQEKPGNWPVTGEDIGGILTATVTTADDCALPVNVFTGAAGPAIYPATGFHPAVNYSVILYNINYYMNDTSGINHRDSLYYWVQQLNSPSGSLTTATLLLEDGYADSALAVYDSIPSVYNLDSIDYLEYTTWGRQLFDVKNRILSGYAAFNNTVAAAYSSGLNIDSVLAADAQLLTYPTLSSGSQDTLMQIFQNSFYWGRTGAECILNYFEPGNFSAMLAAMPDTLLYPSLPDSMLGTASNPGVLMVTEISQGPNGSSGCEYAEMVVGNCGSNASPYVDVSGWILDDNSGNFDTLGCSATGITRGHYRLAPGDPGWQNVPVGSIIIIYNAVTNCYNLPDTFTVDTVNFIFWIPLYDTAAPVPSAYAVQRYDGSENANPGSYCSDTGATVYTPAFGWESTIAFAPQDAFQVRCPGCSTAFPGTPPFYQGIGYAPDSTYCFVSIPAGTGSLGGPVVYDPSSSQKFVFTGSTAIDFSNPAMWSAFPADTAGVAPPTLGNLDSALYANVTNHILGLQCCSYNQNNQNQNQNGNRIAKPVTPQSQPKNIMVYPNPATMTIYFEFPATGEVTIKLLDVTGRLMDEQIVNNISAASFNVGGYTPGIYIYQVITFGVTQTGKILIGK